MGQYYKICNLDKRQFISPNKFYEGAKLLAFGSSSNGTMFGLAILLADGNNRGGGDLRSENPIIGSWAGDRIVIAGDYADEDKFIPETELKKFLETELKNEKRNLYQWAAAFFKDISEQVKEAMNFGGNYRQGGVNEDRKL